MDGGNTISILEKKINMWYNFITISIDAFSIICCNINYIYNYILNLLDTTFEENRFHRNFDFQDFRVIIALTKSSLEVSWRPRARRLIILLSWILIIKFVAQYWPIDGAVNYIY